MMNKLGILEGLLYVQGDEGLDIQMVCDLLEITDEEAKSLVLNLKNSYENDDRGLRINYLGNTFKLTTKEEHKEYYKKLIMNPSTNILSQSALETLAIIAYNQPMTKSMIDELRGVDTSWTLRKVLAKGLIKECGRADTAGHPILYKTTDEFLDYFGLSTINDLPQISVDIQDECENDLYKSNYKEGD